MFLVNTNQSITAVLSAVKTTNDCPISVHYQDVKQLPGLGITGPVPAPGNNALTTSGTSAVTVLNHGSGLAPSGGNTVSLPRQVMFLSIVNSDTVSQTVTLSLIFSPSLTVTLGVFTLATGEQLNYTPEGGFYILSVAGAQKSTSVGLASTYSAITDNSGGTATTSPPTLVANGQKATVVIPVGLLAALVNTTTYQVSLPFGFTILSAQFHTDVPVTTGSKLATLTVSTTAGAVTGGVMALTSANQTPTGAAVAATAISGANATDVATHNLIVTVSSVTTFVEGSGHIEITVSNNDLEANFATLASLGNLIRTNLRAAGLVA